MGFKVVLLVGAICGAPAAASCDPFIRGDANLDGGVDLSDAVTILLHLFAGAMPDPPCRDACDANDDEAVDLSDALAVAGWLFLSGSPPPAPFPDPGPDEPWNGGDDDGDGEVDEGCPGNVRDPSMVPERLVFLVSDERWWDVLRLVPAVAGSAPALAGVGGAEDAPFAIPALVFHVEDDGAFDADSVLDFLRRYRPSRLRLIGPAPEALLQILRTDPAIGLDASRVEEFDAAGIASHWSAIHRVVLVEDDLEKALIASTLASILDAPLSIEGREDGIGLEGKRVLCIGNPAGPCEERWTLEEAEARILALTGTDRALLVRPDLGIYRADSKATLAGGTIRHLFGKTVLPAALLAAYRRELPIAVHAQGVDAADGELRSALERLGWSPGYLTIAASPLEIGQTIQFPRSGDGRLVTWSIDATRYGNVDGDVLGFAERKTGRIYGFSTSDVSAYVARTFFLETLGYSGGLLFIGQGVGATDDRARAYAGLFGRSGRTADAATYADPAVPDDWKGRALINNDAHGSTTYSTISTGQIPPLEGTLVLTASCLTCAFDKLMLGIYGQLFCLQLLRSGATGAVASVDTAGFNWDSTRLTRVMGGDLGSMMLRTQNADHARNAWYIRDLAHSGDYGDLRADIQFLLGDPALRVPLGAPLIPPPSFEIAEIPAGTEIVFRIPSINFESGGMVYAFIEGTDDLVQARYGRFFLEAGPLVLEDDDRVESSDVDPMFFGGVKRVAVQRREDGDHAHFLVEKDLSRNPLDAVVENVIRIRIIRSGP